MLLSETSLLHGDWATQRAFLLGANRYMVGALDFFDGRDPNHMTVSTISGAVYQAGARHLMALRRTLLKLR